MAALLLAEAALLLLGVVAATTEEDTDAGVTAGDDDAGRRRCWSCSGRWEEWVCTGGAARRVPLIAWGLVRGGRYPIRVAGGCCCLPLHTQRRIAIGQPHLDLDGSPPGERYVLTGRWESLCGCCGGGRGGLCWGVNTLAVVVGVSRVASEGPFLGWGLAQRVIFSPHHHHGGQEKKKGSWGKKEKIFWMSEGRKETSKSLNL